MGLGLWPRPCRTGRHQWTCVECRERCCHGWRAILVLPGEARTDHYEPADPANPDGGGWGWVRLARPEAATMPAAHEPGEEG